MKTFQDQLEEIVEEKPDIEIDRERRSTNYLPKIMMFIGPLIIGVSVLKLGYDGINSYMAYRNGINSLQILRQLAVQVTYDGFGATAGLALFNLGIRIDEKRRKREQVRESDYSSDLSD